MSELKTLKDIDLGNSNNYFLIRQEAIKWIKEISKDGFKRTPQIKFNDKGLDISEVNEVILTQETDIVVRWIKHFFNITEEDLK